MAKPTTARDDHTDAPAVEPVERFEPERLRGELVEAEHLVRYWWASHLAAGREVLDAGCGAGYGCAILLDAGAARCVGVDISPEAVEAASESHGEREGIEFVVGDVGQLPFADDSFDLVTCFETIEHVEAQERVVAELARVLRPGGLLVISSPNRSEYPPGNPFHVHELTADEFRALLAGAFADVRLLRQHNWIASAILDDEAFAAADPATPLETRVRKLQGREPGRELYTLAICGDGPLEHVAAGAETALTHGLEVRRWLEEIRALLRLGDELAQTRQALADSERQLLELRDSRSAEMARLERQAYWLERAHVDLDAWMSRRWVRALARVAMAALRLRRRLGPGG